MRKLWLGILATLLLALFVAPSYAWEFSMTGEFEWRQNYLSRMGDNDIFGNVKTQESGAAWNQSVATGSLNGITGYVGQPVTTYVGFAGPNTWGNGFAKPLPNDDAASSRTVITRGGFSRWGDDAYYGDQRLTFRPAIQVNKAIRVFGVYTVGGLRNKYDQTRGGHGAYTQGDGVATSGVGIPPFERYYMHHSSMAGYNTAAIGSWEQVRATIQLPIATFSIGVKDFPFGTGMTYSHADRTDSFLAVVPYGPFRLMLAVWPGQADDSAFGSFDTRPDKETKYTYRYGPLFTYENGPLWAGGGVILGGWHGNGQTFGTTSIGASPQTTFIQNDNPNNGQSFDSYQRIWTWGAKYNNGRFFFNGEYTWVNQDRNYNYGFYNGINYANTATQQGLVGQRYVESSKWMAEFGALVGPAKMSLFTAWSSGQSLPGVNVNDAHVGGQFNNTKWYMANPVNYQVLQPYSYLMFPVYAGGNNAFHADGTGNMADAYCLAARLDYAAAANLNLWGSYIWAHRVEKNGYYAGAFNATNIQTLPGTRAYNNVLGNYYVSPTYPTNTFNAQSPGHAQLFKSQNNTLGTQNNMNPFVDDGYIGWEAQAGVDWKLLENFSASLAYSYWQLGPWFDQAYQAYTGTPGMGENGNGLLVGRDPIQSIRGSLTIDF